MRAEAGLREFDLTLPAGQNLHGYDTGATGRPNEIVVLWHAGSPNIGAPPAPLFPVSDRLGIRWLGYDRPGYGRSTRQPGTVIADTADHARRVADHVGVERFAVVGHSGGGPRALACGALLPERVTAVVAISSLAPWPAEGLEYFAGMNVGSVGELRAALSGEKALAAALETSEPDPDAFSPRDSAELERAWSWFGGIVAAATANGLGGFIDDDLAAVGVWGFDPGDISAPTLLLHGTDDRMVPSSHSGWLSGRVPSSELRLAPDDGHISVLRLAPDALSWLRQVATT